MFKILFQSSSRQVFWWILLHLAVGALGVFSNIFIIVWFYVLLSSAIRTILRLGGSTRIHLFILVYFSSFDVLARMTKCSPLIPYELSKYFILIYSIFVFIQIGRLNRVFIFTLSTTVIGILTTTIYGITRADFVNSGLGIINLLILISIFKGQTIRFPDLLIMLRLMLYTTLPTLAYTFIKTPDYDKIDFKLSANFVTSGGFGSNQVSTILGLGALLVLIFVILGRRLSGSRILDFCLLGGFVLQGLLTFSRGGIFGVILSTIILYYIIFRSNKNNYLNQIGKYKNLVYGGFATIFLASIFLVVNTITNEKLILRYLGETGATVGGYKVKDLNVTTSNRLNIFIEDLEVWAEHPFFGVGYGNSQYFRDKSAGVVAHVELSRLVAEQGLVGIGIFSFWVFLFFQIRKVNKDYLTTAILSTLYAFALLTSFHSSIRTQVTPILTAVATLRVRRD